MIDVTHTTPSGLVVEIRVEANPDDNTCLDWYVIATDDRVPGCRPGDVLCQGVEDGNGRCGSVQPNLSAQFRDEVLAMAIAAANAEEHE